MHSRVKRQTLHRQTDRQTQTDVTDWRAACVMRPLQMEDRVITLIIILTESVLCSLGKRRRQIKLS